MTKKKKSRGRPRKYASDAERSKAYRERKKAKIMQLEQQARELKKRIRNMKGLKQALNPEIEKKISTFLFGFLCRIDGIDFSDNNKMEARKKLENLLETYQEIRSFYETPSEDEI
ncbi:MAG: hypothetical protein ACFFB5_03105 [Promethearchaeota archaeon]